MSTVTVADVTGWIEAAYPPRLAEDWDRVGLAVGDPDAAVTSVAFAVDPAQAVIDEARERGVQLLVTHHPLLLRGVHTVRADQPKGRAIIALLDAGIAQFAAHTNADHAENGVSDALAAALGLVDTRPLVPLPPEPLTKLVTFVPPESADAVRQALFAAGAGALGAYDSCAFTVRGTGQFRALDGASPAVGAVGGLTQLEEDRVEVVAPRHRADAVVAALLAAHPYETPAFDVLESRPGPSRTGTGRIGRLPQPRTASEVAKLLADAAPATASGVRLGGDPDRRVETVALVGGAGDSFLDAARAAGADLYLTSDLRHHPAQDFLAWPDAPVLLDIAHTAAEWLWLPVVERLVRERAAGAGAELQTYVSTLITDPWTLRL